MIKREKERDRERERLGRTLAYREETLVRSALSKSGWQCIASICSVSLSLSLSLIVAASVSAARIHLSDVEKGRKKAARIFQRATLRERKREREKEREREGGRNKIYQLPLCFFLSLLFFPTRDMEAPKQ